MWCWNPLIIFMMDLIFRWEIENTKSDISIYDIFKNKKNMKLWTCLLFLTFLKKNIADNFILFLCFNNFENIKWKRIENDTKQSFYLTGPAVFSIVCNWVTSLPMQGNPGHRLLSYVVWFLSFILYFLFFFDFFTSELDLYIMCI